MAQIGTTARTLKAFYNASSEDMRMTRDLAGVLRGIGVELIDHIIITGSEFTRVSWQ